MNLIFGIVFWSKKGALLSPPPSTLTLPMYVFTVYALYYCNKKKKNLMGLVENGKVLKVLKFYAGSRGIILLQSRGIKKFGIPPTVPIIL